MKTKHFCCLFALFFVTLFLHFIPSIGCASSSCSCTEIGKKYYDKIYNLSSTSRTTYAVSSNTSAVSIVKCDFNADYSAENNFFTGSATIWYIVNGTGRAVLTVYAEDGNALGSTDVTVEHTSIVPYEDRAATCTLEGRTGGTYCISCRAEITTPTYSQKLPHDMTLFVPQDREPTCQNEGFHDMRVCKNCHYTEASYGIPPVDHKPQNMVDIAPTCTENGRKGGKECCWCMKVLEEPTIIPATGHVEVIDPGIPASYESEGWTEGSHCSVCGKIIREQKTIPKLDPTPTPIPVPTDNNAEQQQSENTPTSTETSSPTPNVEPVTPTPTRYVEPVTPAPTRYVEPVTPTPTTTPKATSTPTPSSKNTPAPSGKNNKKENNTQENKSYASPSPETNTDKETVTVQPELIHGNEYYAVFDIDGEIISTQVKLNYFGITRCKISYDGKEYDIPTKDIQFSDAASNDNKMIVINSSGKGQVAIYKNAAQKDKLDEAKNGVICPVIEIKGNWIKIDYFGTIGYVNKKNVKFFSVQDPVGIGKLKVDREINLRMASSKNSKILMKVKPEMQFYVIKKGKTWSLVELDGYAGYIMTQYIDLQ